MPIPDDPYDDGDDDDWTGRDEGGADDDHDREQRWTCVLGDKCLVADPFHSSDECFDQEWAEAYFAESEPESGPLLN